MSEPASVKSGVYIAVDRDGWTKGIQLSVGVQDKDGGGHGYRLSGPKFNGSSSQIDRHYLTERDIGEIEGYLRLARAYLAPTRTIRAEEAS